MASAWVTLLVCHGRRGREAIAEIDVLPGYRGVIVHDGLATYDDLGAADHAQCGAHNTARRLGNRYRYALKVGFATLLAGPPPRRRHTGPWEPHQRDAWNLAVRLDDQADVLRFLTDTRIPFTNNDAERPLRPPKLHNKISGSFRSPAHAKAFAAVRSYLGTADKHGKNLYQALVELFTIGPWLPPEATPG